MTFRIKKGVVLADQLPMLRLRTVIAEVFEAFDLDCVVTSGKDGTHSPGSLHPFGFAEDYDAGEPVNMEVLHQIAQEATNRLNDTRYQIFAHAGHIHGEYDPLEFQRFKYQKKGE